MSVYSCDFETTTKLEDCRVWAFGCMEVGNIENSIIGKSIDDYMSWLFHVMPSRIYFHNLKFDGEFIVNWLFHNGWRHVDKCNGEAFTFHCVISNMGQWYAIELCMGFDSKAKRSITVQIHDSLKKIPFPVKTIAKSFKLSILKGDIDYHAERPIGYHITDEEYAYINNDIQIIAEALDVQFNQGLTAMTNGSDALKHFEHSIDEKLYKKLFPVFDLDLNEQIRKAYRGGFTWLKRGYEGKMIGEGIVFDVNSLYPSQMYFQSMPCGFPITFQGEYQVDKQYPLYIQKIKLEFELKKDHIPTIQLKGNTFFKGRGNEYLHSSEGERIEITVTDVDWKLIQDHYHVYDVEYIEGWKFRSVNDVFNAYINKWMHLKNIETGAKKAIAKLMLNSLYGKFATNPNITGKEPYLKEDGSTGYRLADENYRDPVYTPVGVFITSYARDLTIRSAQKCYDRIIYCDTDSMHLLGLDTPESIQDIVGNDALGFWKKEGTFAQAKFIRQKTYAEEYHAMYKRDDSGNIMFDDDGNPIKFICPKEQADTTIFDVKCAGMPERIKSSVTFENFGIGFTSWGKLKPVRVKGGVVLVDGEFTIK